MKKLTTRSVENWVNSVFISKFIIEEKNRALDEFAQTQNPEGAI
jgi:hypothetical protein